MIELGGEASTQKPSSGPVLVQVPATNAYFWTGGSLSTPKPVPNVAGGGSTRGGGGRSTSFLRECSQRTGVITPGLLLQRPHGDYILRGVLGGEKIQWQEEKTQKV